MTPRLMVICLGGLAGAGALVCCDLNEGLEGLTEVTEGAPVEEGAASLDAAEPDAEPVH